MLAQLAGWQVVGVIALACCLLVGIAALGIAAFFRFDSRRGPRRVPRPTPARYLVSTPAASQRPNASGNFTSSLRSCPAPATIGRFIRKWLTVEHIVDPESSDRDWVLTETWLNRRRKLYRVAIGLAIAVTAGVVVADVISIWHPLLYRTAGSYLYGPFLAILALSLSIIAISTFPWHFERANQGVDSGDYWLSHHPGRLFSFVGLFALALGFTMVYGLANGIGGATGFARIGHHYFETYPGTRPVLITHEHFLASVRAEGVTTSFFLGVAALVCIAVGIELHRVGNNVRNTGEPSG